MSSYLLVQLQNWKDSPKGHSNSRYSLSSILCVCVCECVCLKLISLIPSFSGKTTWRGEGTHLPNAEVQRRHPCPMGATQEQLSGRSIAGACSVSELCRPLVSAAFPRKARFGGVQRLGCWPSCLLIEVKPPGEQSEASACLYVALWSQVGSNNEAEIEGHLSDKVLPSDGTGILCQNVSAGSTYVSVLMTEGEVLMWSYGSEGKCKNK